jgi:DNA-binding IclR family transcriptional regulator
VQIFEKSLDKTAFFHKNRIKIPLSGIFSLSIFKPLCKKMSEPKIVNSVVRAALILQTLSSGNSRIGKISESVKLSKGTTHRLLLTLAKVGFVVQDPLTQGYHLGPGLLQLFSDPILSHNSLISCAFEEMTYLKNLTRETVLLDLRAGLQKVCIEKIDSPENLKYTNEKGFAAPLYVGGGGKILLSELKDDEINIILQQISFVPITPNTIIDPEQLRAEIKKVRQQGYATSFGERVPGSSCVSVPVKNYVAPVALSILGPASRFTPQRIMETIEELKQAAGKVSKNLKNLKKISESNEQ